MDNDSLRFGTCSDLWKLLLKPPTQEPLPALRRMNLVMKTGRDTPTQHPFLILMRPSDRLPNNLIQPHSYLNRKRLPPLT